MAVGEIFGAVLQAGFDLLGTIGVDIGNQKGWRGAAIRLVILLPVAVVCAWLVTIFVRAPAVEFGDIIAALVWSAAAIGALCGCYRAVRVLLRATEPAPPDA